MSKSPTRVFPNCFRCEKPFDLKEGERQYIYCPECREVIRKESESERIAIQVAAMGWPDKL